MANTSHPILEIGNTADPVTPGRYAKKMAEGFPGAVALIQDSAGHCSLSTPSDCTETYVRSCKYTHNLCALTVILQHADLSRSALWRQVLILQLLLLDFQKGELPEPGTICPADEMPFDSADGNVAILDKQAVKRRARAMDFVRAMHTSGGFASGLEFGRTSWML